MSEDPLTPTVWVPGRQAGTSSLPHPYTATRETLVECFPQKPIPSTATLVPAPHPPLICLFSQISSSSSPLSRGPVSQSQTFTVHTCLLQTVCKVPVYLLSGSCPQNIMHHTYKSFTLYVHLLSILSFVCVLEVRLKTNLKKSPQSTILSSLQQITFRAPFPKDRSWRHWVSVWCKTACFGWNTLPPLCSGTVQPRDWSGDDICFFCFVFFNFLFLLKTL